MSTLITMLVAIIPRALMFLAAKVLTEELAQKVIARIVVAGLEHAAKLTTNTVDDEIVGDIRQRLES